MSKLLGASELSRPATQLPLSWYFDSAIYQRNRSFVQERPRYVGHELMVPNANDYRALEVKDSAWNLVNTGSGLKWYPNVCRHRQAVMLAVPAICKAATSSALCTAGPTTPRARCWVRRILRISHVSICHASPW